MIDKYYLGVKRKLQWGEFEAKFYCPGGNAIIRIMSSFKVPISTGRNADIAFALVVLAIYFAIFTQLGNANPVQIILLIILGTIYTLLGVYGYSYAAKSNSLKTITAYFILQLPIGGAIVYLAQSVGLSALVLLPLAGHAAILFPGWRVAVANAAILIAYAVAVFFATRSLQSVWNLLPVFVAGMVFVVVFIQMAVSEERARIEVEALADHLTEANQRLREYASQIEGLAIIQERNRMAREIHDGLGHALTTIHMQLQAAEAIIQSNPNKALNLVSLARTQARDALHEVRLSVSALREAMPSDIPFEERLKELLLSCEVAGIQASLIILGDSTTIPLDQEHMLFRTVQEGVSNICKHSKAKRAEVILDCQVPDTLRLTITDDGIGSDHPFETGFGLTSLRERVSQLNGQIQITTGKGIGFQIMIRIPR